MIFFLMNKALLFQTMSVFEVSEYWFVVSEKSGNVFFYPGGCPEFMYHLCTNDIIIRHFHLLLFHCISIDSYLFLRACLLAFLRYVFTLCIVLYFIALHCIALHCIALHCIVCIYIEGGRLVW